MSGKPASVFLLYLALSWLVWIYQVRTLGDNWTGH